MKCVFTSAILLLFFALVGCDSNGIETEEGEISDLSILPDTASIPVGNTMDFSVVALTASGDTVRNADLDLRWWSTDDAVFTVDDEGTAIALEAGTAFCMVEMTGPPSKSAAPFVGRDSAFVMVF